MRTPEEMLDLILNIAKQDERIRAVTMGGSRACKDCPPDRYQDFDIVYYVEDVGPFWDNIPWIESQFGKPSLVQRPESMGLIPPDNDGNYVYLMIFPDGNRIDLAFTAKPFEDTGEPVIALLDKDGRLPEIHVREDYWYVKRPTQKLFSDCCNEFHWCLNNVAKGIAREELSYAMLQFNDCVRSMLIKMLTWYVGAQHDFGISPGKNGKYLKNHLTPREFEDFRKTYSDGEYEHLWEAAFHMLHFFGEIARKTAEMLSFTYDEAEEQGIETYMKQVRSGLL